VNSYPYYDIFDELYATFNAMITTMNEQHKHLVIEMRECDLLHEIDPSLSSLRSTSSLCDDHQSSLPLGPNFIDSARLTDLDEVFDPSLTSLSFITQSFSNKPIDTIISDLTSLAWG